MAINVSTLVVTCLTLTCIVKHKKIFSETNLSRALVSGRQQHPVIDQIMALVLKLSTPWGHQFPINTYYKNLIPNSDERSKAIDTLVITCSVI